MYSIFFVVLDNESHMAKTEINDQYFKLNDQYFKLNNQYFVDKDIFTVK